MLKIQIIFNKSKYITYLKSKNCKKQFLFSSYTEPHLSSKEKTKKKK